MNTDSTESTQCTDGGAAVAGNGRSSHTFNQRLTVATAVRDEYLNSGQSDVEFAALLTARLAYTVTDNQVSYLRREFGIGNNVRLRTAEAPSSNADVLAKVADLAAKLGAMADNDNDTAVAVAAIGAAIGRLEATQAYRMNSMERSVTALRLELTLRVQPGAAGLGVDTPSLAAPQVLAVGDRRSSLAFERAEQG